MKIVPSSSSGRKRKARCVARAACVLVACALSACATRKEFQKGYERGASDTVKRQYWILQNMQKRDEVGDSAPRLAVYRLPVEPDPDATVKRVPYEISIPIYE
ncbi:MAG: hypothetical protein WA771_02195 [Chthoniobacterales bacterium]